MNDTRSEVLGESGIRFEVPEKSPSDTVSEGTVNSSSITSGEAMGSGSKGPETEGNVPGNIGCPDKARSRSDRRRDGDSEGKGFLERVMITPRGGLQICSGAFRLEVATETSGQGVRLHAN